MKQITWGIIGCGDVAERKSGPAFQNVPNSSLIAVMRRDADKAADFALRHQVPKWYCHAQDIIHDDDINAIYIATPPSSHEKYALAALEAGKHVYLEKPMALDRKSALRIHQKALSSKGKLVIAHYRRALPLFIKVKHLLDEKIIGEISWVDIRMSEPVTSHTAADSETNWRLNPVISGGGLFHDLAPHQLDLMLHYFGEVDEAMGFSINQSRMSAADDLVHGIIKFANGIHLRGVWDFASEKGQEDICEIHGSIGKIAFPFFGDKISVWQSGSNSAIPMPYPQFVQEPMVAQVVNYFLGKGTNPCPGGEAVEVMRIMDIFTQPSQ
ncbi:Gfo/Idh/MocA family protein [Anditalea andensis]|uniref:Oxidoreductase n=1 Tax=Anditalea andensis TaxID=1048983 RepID=A0A074KT27_9BACT|nr:Gfo/Idh/MocA family oxidoreductase [Anditalea andensis]KEO72069.1 oxidoreductase [Anditalea andensis]